MNHFRVPAYKFFALLTTFTIACAFSHASANVTDSFLCPPLNKPCGDLMMPLRQQGGNIIPADFISPDAALLARLGKSFSVTIPANSTALIEVGGVKLSPRQLDPSGKGGTFVFTYKSQKKDLKGNNVFSFNVARK